MSNAQIATYVFWIIPAVAELCAVVIMIQRKIIRELPMFCCFAAYQVVSSLLLFLIREHLGYTTYFYSFSIAEAVSLILGILVISEVFSRIFMDYEALQQLGWVLLRWAVMVLICLAVLSAAAAPGQYDSEPVKVLMLMERSVRVIQAGLLLLLFLFTTFFGVSWKNYVFGIALGFGIFGSVQLAVTALHSSGALPGNAFSLISNAADTVAALIWTAYMLVPARRKKVDALPQVNLDEWNRALEGLLNQ